MNTAVFDQKQIYHEVNSVTGSVNSVLFGTEILSELPVAELIQDFGLNISVCNRSVETAVLEDAFDLLDECVFELNPSKVFLNFGETDLMRSDFDLQTFISSYKRLIETIQGKLKCRIFMVSVLSRSAGAEEINSKLAELAEQSGCEYINASDIFCHEKPRLRLFSELTHHMREGRISFSDAMHFCQA